MDALQKRVSPAGGETGGGEQVQEGLQRSHWDEEVAPEGLHLGGRGGDTGPRDANRVIT